MLIAALLLGAADAEPATGIDLTVDLLCRGRGEIIRTEQVRDRWSDKDKNGKKPAPRYEQVRDRFYGDAQISIRPDGARAQLPGPMMQAYDGKGQWAEIRKLAVTPDKIDGKIRLNFLYSPVFTINRVTGILSIDGSMSNFQGDCQPYDPVKDRRF